MIWFVAGIVVLGLVLLAIYGLVRAEPATLARVLRYTAVAVLVIAIMALAISGRLALAAPLVPLLLWIVGRRRLFPLPGGRQRRASRQSGGGHAAASAIETPWLAMNLDHDSGTMTGRILQGSFEGRLLNDLSLPELLSLRDRIVSDDDADSLSLLETWLDRIYGADWRHEAAQDFDGKEGRRTSAESPGPMTRKEALAVLGLEGGASRDEIRAAHRRLMLKAHPDQGGTAYLAARINQAREVLLGGAR